MTNQERLTFNIRVSKEGDASRKETRERKSYDRRIPTVRCLRKKSLVESIGILTTCTANMSCLRFPLYRNKNNNTNLSGTKWHFINKKKLGTQILLIEPEYVHSSIPWTN